MMGKPEYDKQQASWEDAEYTREDGTKGRYQCGQKYMNKAEWK